MRLFPGNLLTVAMVALITTGCINRSADPEPPILSPRAETSAAAQDPVAREPAPTVRNVSRDQGQDSQPQQRAPLAQLFPGNGRFVNAVASGRGQQLSESPDGITLNFVNTDVRQVARIVLGDLLGLNYAVDPDAQGTVSLQTSRPVSRDGVLAILEHAIRFNGLSLKQLDGIYVIGFLDEVSRLSPMTVGSRRLSPGFGNTVVQLEYVGAEEMRRLLEPIFPGGGIVQIDPARNILVLSGTAQERAMMLENIDLFDVDWLSGTSFGLFTPRNVEAPTLVRELEQIIGSQGGLAAGVLRFISIKRMNAVLVISSQPRYLDDVQRWVERLDKTDEAVDKRIFVYPVQNGRASDIAEVLSQVIKGTQPQEASPQPPVRPEPTVQPGVPVVPGVPGVPLVQGFPGQPQVPAAPTSIVEPIRSEGVSVSGALDVSITPDRINNSLVILATPRDYRIVEAALRQLDTTPRQVLLKAAVAEVTLTDDLRYGVQYFLRSDSGRHQVTRTASNSTAIAPTLPGFSYVLDSTNIDIVIDALDSVTTVNLVSSPEVLVLNNQTAILQVGNEVPIATQQSTGNTSSDAPTVNSIEYRNTGIILEVTPRVNEGGMVMMEILQEVSDVTSTTTSTLDSPTIQQRKISSTIAVQDGETITLGGMIRSSNTQGSAGIPVLKDVPLIGALFGSESDETERTELLVLITPQVIDNLESARSITDELRAKMPGANRLLSPEALRLPLPSDTENVSAVVQ